MKPEEKVKKAVRKILDARGAYYFFPQAGIYGRSGIPDIVGCIAGTFFAVECKAGKNMPTALQEKELLKIDEAGGYSWVVNELTLTSFEAAFKELTK